MLREEQRARSVRARALARLAAVLRMNRSPSGNSPLELVSAHLKDQHYRMAKAVRRTLQQAIRSDKPQKSSRASRPVCVCNPTRTQCHRPWRSSLMQIKSSPCDPQVDTSFCRPLAKAQCCDHVRLKTCKQERLTTAQRADPQPWSNARRSSGISLPRNVPVRSTRFECLALRYRCKPQASIVTDDDHI